MALMCIPMINDPRENLWQSYAVYSICMWPSKVLIQSFSIVEDSLPDACPVNLRNFRYMFLPVSSSVM